MEKGINLEDLSARLEQASRMLDVMNGIFSTINTSRIAWDKNRNYETTAELAYSIYSKYQDLTTIHEVSSGFLDEVTTDLNKFISIKYKAGCIPDLKAAPGDGLSIVEKGA